MAITVKTPRQVAQEYLDNLKALKPEVNIDQTDSDWWIKGRVFGGVLAGVYADLSKVSNDAFPQTARREAVDKHLQVYFGSGLRTAGPAVGSVLVSGATGSTVPANTQFVHTPSAQVYVATQTITLSATTGLVPVQSVASGQAQNLLTNTSLVVSSPPAGIALSATVVSPGLTDGRDDESTNDGANRVLSRIRNPSRGGTASDYEGWAIASDPRVVTARANRHAYGLGTVQVIISAGTNDIDSAIDQGLPIVVQPSSALKEIVRAYIDGLNPITDVVYVDGPTEVTINVNCKVAFVTGTKDTVLQGAGVTQGQLVEREIRRAIYKTPVGGRLVGSVSQLRAADIEEAIDYNLSAQPYTIGVKYQIVGDRQITLTGGTPNITLLNSQVAVPGTITIEAL